MPSLLFDDASRVRFYEIVAQLAALLAGQGLVVLVPATAHRRALRARARALAPRFVEVYVTTALAECERRDPKGLYARARKGEALHLPGVGEPYELPESPDVVAEAHNGEQVALSSLRGRPVVVYFYPRDDTPGCTVEAHELRDASIELDKHRAVVLGVSADDNDSHRAFATKHQLPFQLLPDPDHRIARAFGVPVVNGKAKRVTFVIDKDGKIARVFPDVSPKGHAQELLETVSALES